MPTMLDLFSGLGGASEAFVQAGWTVIRIENNPELSYVPFTRLEDVNNWRSWARDLPTIDLIWASPPCLEFSMAYNAPRSIADRENREWNPDMNLLESTISIIDYLKPRWWTIENVAGASTYFNKYLGEPKQKIGPFVLWKSDTLPYIVMPHGFSHKKGDNDTWSDDSLRSNRRAMIPFEVSFALLRTLKEQKTLVEF